MLQLLLLGGVVVAGLRRWHGLGDGGDWAGDGVSVVCLEPRDEGVHTRVHLTSVAVAVGSQGEVFNHGLCSGLVSQGKLARSLSASTEEVWYSLGILFPLF